MNEKKKLKIYIIPIILVAIFTGIDQLSKHIISSKFELFESKKIINKILNFTYIRNEGMAWGMLSGQRIFFLIVTSIITIFCIIIYVNASKDKKYWDIRITLIILISGAIGNMIDRFRYGYVVDFFDVRFIDFPVFNIADIYVVVSMFLVGILILFKYKEEDLELLLKIKH